jgi:hypothetical protein
LFLIFSLKKFIRKERGKGYFSSSYSQTPHQKKSKNKRLGKEGILFYFSSSRATSSQIKQTKGRGIGRIGFSFGWGGKNGKKFKQKDQNFLSCTKWGFFFVESKT